MGAVRGSLAAGGRGSCFGDSSGQPGGALAGCLGGVQGGLGDVGEDIRTGAGISMGGGGAWRGVLWGWPTRAQEGGQKRVQMGSSDRWAGSSVGPFESARNRVSGVQEVQVIRIVGYWQNIILCTEFGCEEGMR